MRLASTSEPEMRLASGIGPEADSISGTCPMDQVLHVFEADLSRFRLLGQAAIEALRLYRRNWSVVLLARKSAIQICVMFEEL